MTFSAVNVIVSRAEGLVFYQLLPVIVTALSFGVVWYVHREQKATSPSNGGMSVKQMLWTGLVVVVYCASGPIIIMANKHLIADTGFSFPLAIASIGVFFSFMTAVILTSTGIWPLDPSRNAKQSLMDVIPIGILTAVTNGLSNAAMIYLPVSLLQMVKPSAIVLVVIVVVFMRLDYPSMMTYVAVTVIAIGSFLVVESEHHQSSFTSSVQGALFIGLALQFGSGFSEALKSAFTQYLYQKAKMPFMDSMLYTMGVIFALQMLACGYHEFAFIARVPAEVYSGHFFLLCFASGTCGILLNFSTFWITKEFGAIPLKVLNEVRFLIAIYAGVLVRGESLLFYQSLSFCVILVGVAMFSSEKMSEKSRQQAKGELDPLVVDPEKLDKPLRV